MSTRASCLELLLYGFVLIIKPFFFLSQSLHSFSLFLMHNRLPSFLCLIIFGQQLPTGFGMLVMWLPSDFSVLSSL